MISDDENDQTVTGEAFDLLHTIIRKRLALGRLTVVDATNVQREARRPLISIAREHHCLPVAIVFDFPEKLCQTRNQQRKDRNFGPHVIRQQRSQMRRSIKGLKREGFRHLFTIDSEQTANTATIQREPLWNNKKELCGPFDIIGDIHGCCDELERLLSELGYARKEFNPADETWGQVFYNHPENRKALFLGDLVDRGPRVIDTLRLVRNMVQTGNALCVPGNHDIKFLKKLWGKNVQITHGLDKTLAEYEALPDETREHFRQEVITFIHGLISHYVLDGGDLVIAHAGMSQDKQGRGSGKVREFALYGETTGETDEFGLPVRYNWASDESYLEHPVEAFAYYRSSGVTRVICEEKHMGSRAIVVVCQDEDIARSRFGVENDGAGIVFTRTGRRFFNDPSLEQDLIAKVRTSLEKSGFWEKLDTRWVCLDCELMPWSAKAQELLKKQYAAVGSSATAALTETISALEQVSKRGDLETDFTVRKNNSSQPVDIDKVLRWYKRRFEMVKDYQNAYRHYCWPVETLQDLKLAPFHVLATEKSVHADKNHEWHMETIHDFCVNDSDILLKTTYKQVDLNDPQSQRDAASWWETLTGDGGEGIVVKPYDFVAKGKRGLIQPAVKVRGREYLRIIYGPEYTAKRHMDRLKGRNLGRKQSLALREFALGIESLERFVRKEPLRYVHECVFGVLALESEPVDPRL